MSARNRGKPLPDEEFRYWRTNVEVRSEGEQRSIGGVFAPYNQRSRLLPGGFYEVICPTALRKSLADHVDIVCRLEHDPRYLLATTESKTLEIEDDPNVGASYRALLPDTGAGHDAWELVRTGRLNHSSMGFMCPPGGDEFRREGSTIIRQLITVRLTEASPVSQPGYIETFTAVRHLAGQIGENPDDVAALAAQGELRTLFNDRHPTIIDMGAGVEQRSDESAQRELELRRQLSDERAQRYGIDTDKMNDPGYRLLLWHRRKSELRAPVTETRSQWMPVVPQ